MICKLNDLLICLHTRGKNSQEILTTPERVNVNTHALGHVRGDEGKNREMLRDSSLNRTREGFLGEHWGGQGYACVPYLNKGGRNRSKAMKKSLETTLLAGLLSPCLIFPFSCYVNSCQAPLLVTKIFLSFPLLSPVSQ